MSLSKLPLASYNEQRMKQRGHDGRGVRRGEDAVLTPRGSGWPRWRQFLELLRRIVQHIHRLKHVFNNVHDDINLSRGGSVASMGCGTPSIKCCCQDFSVLRAYEARSLKFIELLVKTTHISYLFHHDHIHKSPRTHHRQTIVVGIQRPVNFVQQKSHIAR